MSRPRSSLTPPPRPPETPIEVLYNTAVQSFVRRDHLKTQAALARLLQLLPPLRQHWADFSPPPLEDSGDALSGKSNGHVDGSEGSVGAGGEEWTLKALKLFITWHVSLYTDPPPSPAGLSDEVVGLLPPTLPAALLEHLESICRGTIAPSTSTSRLHGHAGEREREDEESVLPPALVSTLLLAALKLKPLSSSLHYAHHLAESWLAHLPQELFTADGRPMPAPQKRRLEGAREGYLRVLELFVGEVLAREGEWEMARGILDGEAMMGSKRKEGLYKHLRVVQARPAPAPSPSSSTILDPAASLNASGLLPPAPNGAGRARSSSTSASSSSSERTARPSRPNGTIAHGVRPLSVSAASTERVGVSRDARGKGKGKGRAVDSATADTDDESSVPSKIYIHHRAASAHSDSASRPWTVERSARRAREVLLGFLPSSLAQRLETLSPLQLLGWALPVPLLGLLLLIIGLRRRLRRRTPGVAVDVSQGLRERLNAAGGRAGLRAWVVWFLRWWLDKMAGVWRMGTTITYL